MGFSNGTSGKEPACQCRRHETQVQSGQEGPLEEDMATHFSILAWRISWAKELDELQSISRTKSRTKSAKSRTRLKRLSTHAECAYTEENHERTKQESGHPQAVQTGLKENQP